MTGCRFSIPAEIVYGVGELSNFGEIRHPGKTALIITGGSSDIYRHGYLGMNQISSGMFAIAVGELKRDRFMITGQDLKVFQGLSA